MALRKFAASALLSVSICTYAQKPSEPPSTPAAQTSAADRAQIEAMLKKYESAYFHMSMYDLQQVWPELPNQKKEYRKAEDLLKRGDVSDVVVLVEIHNVEVSGDDATVHGVQSEQYRKNERATYYGGDNTMGKVGTQTAGPVGEANKRAVKKSYEVTIHAHRKGDSWLIASMEETGKHH